MITANDYRQRIAKMRPNIYMDGKLVGRDHPSFAPGINTLALTYDLAQSPEHSELLTAKSHLTGETINRFTHLHQSPEDLLKSRK